jgi:hypothetical protein
LRFAVCIESRSPACAVAASVWIGVRGYKALGSGATFLSIRSPLLQPDVARRAALAV